MRRIVAALAAGAFLLPVLAAGRELPSYDLSELVLQSRGIVLAERLEEPVPRKPTRFRIKRVFAGPFLPGSVLQIDTELYELKGIEPLDGLGIQLDHIEPDHLLFLTDQGPNGGPPGGEELSLKLLWSGIKVLSGGKVYGFRQFTNPGPYCLIGHDITLENYLEQLRDTIDRVEDYRRASRIEEPARRMAGLLKLLSFHPPRLPFLGEYDHLEARSLDELQESCVRDIRRLQDVTDPACALTPLIKDADPRVRAAACATFTGVSFERRGPDAFGTVLKAWTSETDEAARFLMLQCLGRLSSPDHPFPRDGAEAAVLPAIYAEGAAFIAFAAREGCERPANVSVVLTGAGSEVGVRCECPAELLEALGREHCVRFPLGDGLPPGCYRFGACPCGKAA